MRRFALLLLVLYCGERCAQAQLAAEPPSTPWQAGFAGPPLAAPATSPGAEVAAQLLLPKDGETGYLIMPDGQQYSIVAGSALAEKSAAASEAPASSSPPGAVAGAAANGQQDNGTNPAQNTTTFIASNEFYELDGGNQINTSFARLKFPFYDQRGSFLLEIPFVFYDFTSTNPALPEVGGIGDVKFQVSYNTCIAEDKKLTMINFLEMYVPSADTAIVELQPGGNELTAFNLGTGKYVLGPGLGFVYMIEPNFLIAPLYFYEASVAGDDDRIEIRRGKWRIFAMYAWESGAYMLPECQILTNYLTGNNDAYVAPEVGYSAKRTTFYTKPGVGIHPDSNDREWGIEFGARIQF